MSDRNLHPFWNESCDDLTQKIWLPRQISPLPTTSHSWFDVSKHDNANLDIRGTLNYKATPQQSKTLTRCRKIRVLVSYQEKHIFQEWYNHARYTYNKLLSLIKNKTETDINEYRLRNKYVLNHTLPPEEKFLLKTPKDIRAHAVEQLVTVYKNNFEKRKNDPSHTFDIKFRSKKKCLQESIQLPVSAFRMVKLGKQERTGQKVYVKYTQYPLISRNDEKDPLPEKITHACTLVRDKAGRFYLCVPETVAIPTEEVVENQDFFLLNRVASLDPGIRIFMTCFSNSGVKLYGKGAASELIKLAKYLDRMISFAHLSDNKKQRRSLKKFVVRLRAKMKNLVKDMHDKIISNLLQDHDVILIPKFEVSQMVKKGKRRLRRLRKCQVRGMMALCHYEFRERLKEKAETMPGKRILECTEEYTSKTCTGCGNIKFNLGGEEIYVCDRCNLVILRDVNGARNILIKFIESRRQDFILR